MSQMYDRAKLVEDVIRQVDIQGMSRASLAEVIEDSLHPELKEHILELHERHYQGRSGVDFNRDFKNHEYIVRFFQKLDFEGFSLHTLYEFRKLENRLIQEGELNGKLSIESQAQRMRERLESYLSEISPLASEEGAQHYLKQKDRERALVRISDVNMNVLARVDSIKSENELYENYLTALVMYKNAKKELSVARENRISFQNSFSALDSSESWRLKAFKSNKDEKYCSFAYSAAYGNWRRTQLRNLPEIKLRITFDHDERRRLS